MESRVIEILRVHESAGRTRVYPKFLNRFLVLRFFLIKYFWWVFPVRRSYRYRIEWRGPVLEGWVDILGISFFVITKDQMVDFREDTSERLFLKSGDKVKVFLIK